MSQPKKRAAALAAVSYVEPGSVVGVGSGSTANEFIDALAGIAERVEATVASSVATAERLRGHGLRVIDLGEVDSMPLYVDGADEATRALALIKAAMGRPFRLGFGREDPAFAICRS